MININEMTPANGRMLGETEMVNVTDLQKASYDSMFSPTG